jgi:hypothetical protein
MGQGASEFKKYLWGLFLGSRCLIATMHISANFDMDDFLQYTGALNNHH